MPISGKYAQRRKANAEALAAFGVSVDEGSPDTVYRTIRSGDGASNNTIFTIGYEGRDIDDLIARLRDAAVDVLVDVREKPFSRKPDFRKGRLQDACDEAGIEYQSWTRLGSTGHQREKLHETGDIGEFMRRFRDLARRSRGTEVDDLAILAKDKCVALLCYERDHCECHRSVIADLLADQLDSEIVAIT